MNFKRICYFEIKFIYFKYWNSAIFTIFKIFFFLFFFSGVDLGMSRSPTDDDLSTSPRSGKINFWLLWRQNIRVGETDRKTTGQIRPKFFSEFRILNLAKNNLWLLKDKARGCKPGVGLNSFYFLFFSSWAKFDQSFFDHFTLPLHSCLSTNIFRNSISQFFIIRLWPLFMWQPFLSFH